MKRKIMMLVPGIMLTIVCVFGQTSPKDTEAYKAKKLIYSAAMRYNDVMVARNALYDLMVLDPADYSLLDSLAFLYFDYRQYASTALICKDILARNPNHMAALEMSAISFENLRLYDQALKSYESLYLKQNALITLYKITYLQLQLNRFSEFENNAKTIIADPKATETMMVFNGADNTQQEVPMLAAIYNMQGLVAQNQGDNENAKALFDKALEVMPDFYLAKLNRDALK